MIKQRALVIKRNERQGGKGEWNPLHIPVTPHLREAGTKANQGGNESYFLLPAIWLETEWVLSGQQASATKLKELIVT